MKGHNQSDWAEHALACPHPPTAIGHCGSIQSSTEVGTQCDPSGTEASSTTQSTVYIRLCSLCWGLQLARSTP